MKIKNKNVCVFGSSSPSPGDDLYEQAVLLGKLLAREGYTVMNGVYIGTMEAVSEGAFSENGHVIGVSCDEIESYRPIDPNKWITHEIRTKSLNERIQVMVNNCCAAIALAGGVGTSLEVFTMWNQIQIGAIPPKPLIVVGSRWHACFQHYHVIFKEFIHQEAINIIQPVPDIQEAVRMILDNHNIQDSYG